MTSVKPQSKFGSKHCAWCADGETQQHHRPYLGQRGASLNLRMGSGHVRLVMDHGRDLAEPGMVDDTPLVKTRSLTCAMSSVASPPTPRWLVYFHCAKLWSYLKGVSRLEPDRAYATNYSSSELGVEERESDESLVLNWNLEEMILFVQTVFKALSGEPMTIRPTIKGGHLLDLIIFGVASRFEFLHDVDWTFGKVVDMNQALKLSSSQALRILVGAFLLLFSSVRLAGAQVAPPPCFICQWPSGKSVIDVRLDWASFNTALNNPCNVLAGSLPPDSSAAALRYTQAEMEDLVQRAIETWNREASPTARLVYGGISAVAGDVRVQGRCNWLDTDGDGNNNATSGQVSNPSDNWECGSAGTVTLTVNIEQDIPYDGPRSSANRTDAQAMLTHEFGHVLGLAHPHRCDIAGPAATPLGRGCCLGALTPCGAGCPVGQVCSNGSCVPSGACPPVVCGTGVTCVAGACVADTRPPDACNAPLGDYFGDSAVGAAQATPGGPGEPNQRRHLWTWEVNALRHSNAALGARFRSRGACVPTPPNTTCCNATDTPLVSANRVDFGTWDGAPTYGAGYQIATDREVKARTSIHDTNLRVWSATSDNNDTSNATPAVAWGYGNYSGQTAKPSWCSSWSACPQFAVAFASTATNAANFYGSRIYTRVTADGVQWGGSGLGGQAPGNAATNVRPALAYGQVAGIHLWLMVHVAVDNSRRLFQQWSPDGVHWSSPVALQVAVADVVTHVSPALGFSPVLGRFVLAWADRVTNTLNTATLARPDLGQAWAGANSFAAHVPQYGISVACSGNASECSLVYLTDYTANA